MKGQGVKYIRGGNLRRAIGRACGFVLVMTFALTITTTTTARAESFSELTARTPVAPNSHAYRQVGGSMLTLKQLADSYGLTLVSAPGAGHYELQAGSTRMRFFPGLPIFSLNGRGIQLASMSMIVNGSLRIPEEALRYFPAGLRGHVQRVRTGRVGRADLGIRGSLRGTVILDPGHGGRDTGTVGNGLREKDVVLDIALRTAEILRRHGAKVILTRGTDRFISLEQRSRIANSTPGAIFVSIHANAAAKNAPGRHLISGVETYVLSGVSEAYRVGKASRKYDLEEATVNGVRKMRPAKERRVMAGLSRTARTNSRALAKFVQNSLLLLGEKDRKVKGKNLHVLRENYFTPAILTEVGFLTNAQTARKLANAAVREKFATAIAVGIARYLQATPRR